MGEERKGDGCDGRTSRAGDEKVRITAGRVWVERAGDALRSQLDMPMLFHSPTVEGAALSGLTQRSLCMRSTVP